MSEPAGDVISCNFDTYHRAEELRDQCIYDFNAPKVSLW